MYILQAFPGCVLGVSQIGFIMISYGAVDALASLLVGRIERYVGRKVLFVFAKLITNASLVVMIVWNPTNGYEFLMYLLPAMWAIADAVWQVSTTSEFQSAKHRNLRCKTIYLRCFSSDWGSVQR